MILLVDIGNTRIKWAWLDNGVLGPQSAAAHTGWTRDDLAGAILKPGVRADRILVSNVAGDRMAALVRSAIVDGGGAQMEFVRSTRAAGGIRNRYYDVGKLGVDRWLGMIGARTLEQRAVCVVGVGTAMTIDGVDATGRHVGGVIVPGPDLMVASLLRNTSDIASRAAQGSATDELFADNTLGAIQQGAVHALAALIERAMVSLQQEVAETPTLLMTGGASERVERLLKRPFRPVPDLVLRGLAVLANEPGGRQ